VATGAFALSAHVRSGGAGIVLNILPVTDFCDIGVIGLTRQVREYRFVGLKWVLLDLFAPNTNGTNTIIFLSPKQVCYIPTNQTVTYRRIVINHRPQKEDPNRVLNC
jgi:hypothetical protein